jgi:hypothetical protein
MTHPLEDARTFRSLAKTHAKEIRLLKDIIWRWRRYSAFVPGVDGYWAAWPLPQWREWNGNPPRRTFDRWLKTLEDFGLIERERHRYSGNTIHSFIRPSPLALKHLGDDADLARLRVKTPTRKKAKSGAPHGATVGAADGATVGATDHTSFPSSASCPSKPKTSHAHAHTGGEGKAGEDVKIKKKLILKKQNPKAPIPPAPDDDDLEAAFEAVKAKSLEKWLAIFPRIEGEHGVWHPADQHDAWTGWSLELKKQRYAVYVAYVTKALKAKSAKTAKGKSSKGDSGFYTGKKPGGLFGLLKKT